MHRNFVTCAVILGMMSLAAPARPCSRVLWNDNGRCVLVGRNMDWFEDMKSNIWVLPRGMKREGMAARNPLTWTSRYGSIAITGYEAATVTDLTHGVLYYDGVFSPQVFWLDIRKLNFAAGEPVRKLTVAGNFELAGEVSAELQRAEMFRFLGPG